MKIRDSNDVITGKNTTTEIVGKLQIFSDDSALMFEVSQTNRGLLIEANGFLEHKGVALGSELRMRPINTSLPAFHNSVVIERRALKHEDKE